LSSLALLVKIVTGTKRRFNTDFFELLTEKKDLSYLTNLPEATKKLKIFHADLDDSNSFEKAIQGCIGVFI
jgi:hypothetical protein